MKKKKIIAWMLAAAMTLSMLTGCGSGNTGTAAVTETATPTETAAVTETTVAAETVSGEEAAADTSVTVTDGAGRKVTLEGEVDEILTVYAIRYVLALGLGDKLVNGTDDPFYLAVCPQLADKTAFSSRDLSTEVIAELAPDVFIHKSSAVEMMDELDMIGINSIGVYMETPDEVVATVELLGKALGAEARAQELADYYRELMAVGGELTADVAEEDKPRAILMGNEIGKVANASMLQSIMIESAGGVNMAAEIESEETWPVVGTEQIFEWNPEYIFIMNSTSRSYDAETLLTDPAWADVAAVKNNHVYVVPSDLDSWEYPGIQSGLGTIWMISKMYPERMTDEQLETYVNDFYSFVYNVSLTREELNY